MRRHAGRSSAPGAAFTCERARLFALASEAADDRITLARLMRVLLPRYADDQNAPDRMAWADRRRWEIAA